jgi:hypothetical protein
MPDKDDKDTARSERDVHFHNMGQKEASEGKSHDKPWKHIFKSKDDARDNDQYHKGFMNTKYGKDK